jgi:hypothetical protein
MIQRAHAFENPNRNFSVGSPMKHKTLFRGNTGLVDQARDSDWQFG